MDAGVIGSGVGKRLHVPALDNVKDVVVRPIHLSHLGSNKSWSSAELDRYLPLDLVVIATPTYAHLSYLRALSDHCKFILCEKPVGVTQIELSQFLETCDPHCHMIVNYQLRFHTITLRIRDLIGERTSKVHIIYKSDAGFYDGPEWYKNEDIGGGALLAVGSHLIDLVHFTGLKYSSLKAAARMSVGEGLVIEGFDQTGLQVIIDIDVKAEIAEFTVRIFNQHDVVVGDFIGNQVLADRMSYPLQNHQTGHRTLSSSAPDGPWRYGQDRLYLSMVSKDSTSESPNLRASPAQLVDALSVHKVISAVRRSILNSSETLAVNYAP
jgi:predicted dehydrogenase